MMMVDNKVIAVGAILFFALSPGVLLTIPAGKGCPPRMALSKQKGGCATSFAAAAVHALVWAVIFKFLYSSYLYPEIKDKIKEDIKESIRRRRRRRR